MSVARSIVSLRLKQWLLKKNENSPMQNKLNKAERAHVGRIKSMPCGVCDAPAPSDAHHIKQHYQYLCIPLCKDCHQGAFNGIHGQARIWKVMKKDEQTVLNDTIRRLTMSQQQEDESW
jgi:hypothetical protein